MWGSQTPNDWRCGQEKSFKKEHRFSLRKDVWLGLTTVQAQPTVDLGWFFSPNKPISSSKVKDFMQARAHYARLWIHHKCWHDTNSQRTLYCMNTTFWHSTAHCREECIKISTLSSVESWCSQVSKWSSVVPDDRWRWYIRVTLDGFLCMCNVFDFTNTDGGIICTHCHHWTCYVLSHVDMVDVHVTHCLLEHARQWLNGQGKGTNVFVDQSF